MSTVRVCILTVSDRASRGHYQDLTGPAIVELLQSRHAMVLVDQTTVPDEQVLIREYLRQWTDLPDCGIGLTDIIFTNGGTGLSSRDVTPEATLSIIDRQIPGLAEAMRAAGRINTPFADLSRQIAGQRNQTLIVNLPGSIKGATESLLAIVETLPHAVQVIGAQI